jgi:ABC-type branched-subunit amino acid transport system ATPase component/ABC-type branched-subunit amino acid transport system permease subunit
VTALSAPTRTRSWLPPRRTVLQVGVFVLVVVVAKLAAVALDRAGAIRMATPLPVILLGTIIGLTYGLLSVGLVLVYRSNRIINFAHGQIGAFGAAFFGLAAVKWHLPYWVAFPIALLVAAGTGAAAEAGVVRRLRNAPRLMSIVATLGVGQFLVVFASAINSTASAGSLFPQPPLLPVFEVGALRVTQAYSGMLFLTPLLVVGIAVFLRRSRFGLSMRAAAANPEAARMAGIFAGRMSSLAWGIAGALSAFTAILTAPTQGFTGGDSFGPALLLRAMTGAVIARMNNLPQALFAGVGLGIIEQLLLWNYPRSGLVEVTLFGIILVALLLQRQRGGRDEEKGSWASVQALRPVPAALRELWLVRNIGLLLGLATLGFALVLPQFVSNTFAVTLTGIVGFSIVGLSIGVLTGLGGQLTLGQFAVAAIGAVVSYQVSMRTGSFPLSILYAGLTAGGVSVLLGLPALRIRGVMLTVTTLSFALATPAWLLAQPWMLGNGQDPGRPIVFGHPLDTGRSYYYFAFGLLVIALIIARNVRRSGFGRLLVAIRDNEDNARAFTVRASLVKVQGYFLAGFIAGLGGVAYGHALSSIGVATFQAQTSIDVVVMTVIGGISVMTGPILGALYVFGVPLLPLDSAGLAASKFGALLLILWRPAGVVQLVEPVRDWIVRRIARWHGIDADAAYADAEPSGETAAGPAVTPAARAVPALLRDREHRRKPKTGTVLLDARGLRRHFGGVQAVQDVSLQVRAGQTVGLIGPNGAGKTTTFELLGGFTKPHAGTVVFDQRDITRFGPEARARLGLIRSFQDAALFPTMTVTEAVMLAMERIAPTGFLSSAAGINFSERGKERQARELVVFMGLERYQDKQIQQLSTGTRRITEIACLVALQPVLLLLDEPSSGVAQRETEALADLLQDLKRQLDLSLLVIEHDIPLIMGISDEVVAMADGRVLSRGTPDEVRNDPRVVEAYLGASTTAIERSGVVTGAAEPELLLT